MLCKAATAAALLQGFGGITSSVIREAAHTAQRPALKPDLALLAAVSGARLHSLQVLHVSIVFKCALRSLRGFLCPEKVIHDTILADILPWLLDTCWYRASDCQHYWI